MLLANLELSKKFGHILKIQARLLNICANFQFIRFPKLWVRCLCGQSIGGAVNFGNEWAGIGLGGGGGNVQSARQMGQTAAGASAEHRQPKQKLRRRCESEEQPKGKWANQRDRGATYAGRKHYGKQKAIGNYCTLCSLNTLVYDLLAIFPFL